MDQEKKPVIQFLKRESKLWYDGRNVHIPDMDAFLQKIPEFWSSEKDELIFFTFYDDGSYNCERKRQVYDYKSKSFIVRVYEFLEPSLDQAKELYETLSNIYEEQRILELKESKEAFAKEYITQFDIVNANIRSQRSILLQKTDWTQLPDSPLDEETKSLWRKFRKHLRDMTQTEEWMTGNILKVDFPIDPETYLLRYPNREVEYLSTEDQFKNQVIAQLQYRYAKLLEKLKLPASFSYEENIYEKSYDELRDSIDGILQKIDPDLKISVTLRETTLGACADLGTNQMSGLTPENREMALEYNEMLKQEKEYKPLEDYLE